MVRIAWAVGLAGLAASPAAALCTPSQTTMCLRDDRFRLEVTWRNFQGQMGQGTVVDAGTPDSGLFWFFSAENWEMLVKVLDGCGQNDHFWVFAAATTNVEYTLVVTDEETGATKSYFNPLGVSSAATTDTAAFATCDAQAPPPPPPPPPPSPGQLPSFASLSLYDVASPLNRPIDPAPAVDPRSDELVASLVAGAPLVVQVRQYTSPVFFADASTPRVDVPLFCGPFWELGVDRLTSVPIPAGAQPSFDTDGASNPPVGCGEDSDQDNHMVVLDLESRCEYDFWQMRRQGGGWAASWGAAIEMDSDGIYPAGLSTRGSGFAFLGGLIWPDELAAGRIDHALAFNYPFTRSGGPVAPATDSDGVTGQAFALPEGALVQLDPQLDLATLGLAPYERTIAEALQRYGMYLVDTGGDSGIGLYAIDPKSASGNVWAGLLPNQDFVELPGIPLDRLRVLRLPAQDTDWQDHLAVPQNRCAAYR